MDVRTFLPSLTNLPVFYAEAVSLLLLLSVSSYALFLRLRTGRDSTRPGVPLTVRLAVPVPARLLWLFWVAFGVYWLGFAGLVAGSRWIIALALGAALAFALFSAFLVYWLRGRTWADAAMMLLIVAVVAVVSFKYTLWLCEPAAHSALRAAQWCAGRLYAEGRGGALRDPRAATETCG